MFPTASSGNTGFDNEMIRDGDARRREITTGRTRANARRAWGTDGHFGPTDLFR